MSRLYALVVLFFATNTCFAQLSGNKNIPGNYPSLSAAINELNTQGVGTGGVTFNLAAGYVETAPTSGILLTATGTAANPIVIQKNGSGANPKINRTDAGTIGTSILGGQGDAVIIIQGSDYVTFNGVDVEASESGIEYGYYIRKATGTNGCKNVSIRNAAVTLNKGMSAYVVGIYISNNNNSSSAFSPAGITVASLDGVHDGITLTGNTVSNVFAGIVSIGYQAPSPYNLYDRNLTIGTDGQGNTIQNFAGNVPAESYGIYTLYIRSANISYNTINNTSGGGTAATNNLSGINFGQNIPTGMFPLGIPTGDNYIANNNNINLSQSSGAAVYYIRNANSVNAFTANNNSFAAGIFFANADSYFIFNNNITYLVNINSNQTVGTITKTGSGSLYGYHNNLGYISEIAIITGNNFSNILLGNSNTFAGILVSGNSYVSSIIRNNIISNITGNLSSVMYGIKAEGTTNNSVIANNTINNLYGAQTIYGIWQLAYSGGARTLPIQTNTVTNLTATNFVCGLYFSSNVGAAIVKNKIANLTATGNTGITYGLHLAVRSQYLDTYVYNNLIGNLNAPAASSSSDAVIGINLTNAFVTPPANTTVRILFNTVYLNVVSAGTNFSSSALFHTSNTGNLMLNLDLRNNILVNTSVPKGNGYTCALRRSATGLDNYASTSNNNLFYAGTPSAKNLLYFDGVHMAATTAQLYPQVAPRETNSVTEMPPFTSVDGDAGDFLHIQYGVPTKVNNGAAYIPEFGITDDYDGDPRGGSCDIGADEINIILPITLEYLKGKQAGTGNLLNWKVSCTAPQITLVLQRSSDGRNFNRTISSIQATKARCSQPFDATDASPLTGVNYYRLQMIDIDGKITYSPIVAILNGKAGAELVGLYPTLVQDLATLSITASRTAQLQLHITDMSGKRIRTISQLINSGSTLVPINTAGLAAGIYQLTGVLDGNSTHTLRFVKQ